MTQQLFPPRRDFHSLSVRDLLDAREAYHVHLRHLRNVVATAIGRFHIRNGDPDSHEPDAARARDGAPRRTLYNSSVRRWSWPCVLVFVDRWRTLDELRSEPDQVVPRLLYLPDGRVVPTCVLLAEPDIAAPAPLANLSFPSDLGGGGYPIVTEVQGQEHVGSLGCLVTDGDAVYALTNRHVAGGPGREVFTMLNGARVTIGITSDRQIGKLRFGHAYPGWPGEHTYATVDAALVRLEDVSLWTAQVFGIGELDEVVDLNSDTISLDLIGCPVRGFGGASGEMLAEIRGLFYRYRSLGGVDYVSDLLIGPRTDGTPFATHPGDSGTLWFHDPLLSPSDARAQGKAGLRARRSRPIGLQWGGHRVLASAGAADLNFALATCLSTICRELDVDVVRDWNIGHPEYWGKTGHYKIAAKACDLVPIPALKKLLAANLDRIAFGDAAIESGALRKIEAGTFAPLADVPDLVWRTSRKLDEGNHFADMDQKGAGEFAGQTLLDLCKDPANVSVEVWNRFYDSLKVGAKRGALPFRVWEIYDAMIGFVRAGKVAEYVCAAGILAHYVGDACQPLHVSMFHHGHPNNDAESAVHSAYETTMIDRFAVEMIDGVNTALKGKTAKADVSGGGHAAAVAVVGLMRDTIATLPPLTVIAAFDAASGTQRMPHMWQQLGKATITCIAAGCLRLAAIWASAWKAGNGSKIAASQLQAIDRKTLKKLYNDPKFLPARRLTAMTDLH